MSVLLLKYYPFKDWFYDLKGQQGLDPLLSTPIFEKMEIISTTRARMPLLMTLLLEEIFTSPSTGAKYGLISFFTFCIPDERGKRKEADVVSLVLSLSLVAQF